MSKDPYKTYEGGAGVADIAAAASCAATAFPNPMGGIQNAQAAYHNHKFMKLRHEGNKQAVANGPAGEERRREWSSPQMMASLENDLPMDNVGRLIDDKRAMRASEQFPENDFTGKHGLSKSEAAALMQKFEKRSAEAKKVETKKVETKKDEIKKKKWFH